jgi:exodeoxyribonuclease X
MKLLFLDTETTDIQPDARLVQLAYKSMETGETVNEYFKPPVTITYGSMAIHHVTNEMVAAKPAFEGSEQEQNLRSRLETEIIVAHNAPFDINILQNEGINVSKYIDTLRIARHMIQADQYKLQYLRYFLNLNVEGLAHDALGDVLVLEALFNHLLNVVKEKFSLVNDDAITEKLLELTKTPVVMDAFTFGKHRGKSFKEVNKTDQSYLKWLHGSEVKKPTEEQNEDLVHTLNFFLEKQVETQLPF